MNREYGTITWVVVDCMAVGKDGIGRLCVLREVSRPLQQFFNRFFKWHTLALLLIVVGLAITLLFGTRALHAYREIQYIRAEGLDRGDASVTAIRPWMTIRYVAVAYAVPEEYIFAHLAIPYNRRNSNAILGRLNDAYALGTSPNGDYPLVVDRVAQAILAYRADPVATGLREIRPWMTLRYIANSTGVPESYLLEKLGLNAEQAAAIDATVRPLDELGPELHLPGGPEAFFDRIREAIDSYEAEQP
jgi:hypothetical protein